MREGTSHLARCHSESASTRTISAAEGLPSSQDTFARRHSESASTHTISAEGSPSSRHAFTARQRERFDSAEGSPSSRHIRAAPQRGRFDTHNLRRGLAELKTISHGATARALRHARSPQRVRRAQDTFAPRHSESRRAQETLARRRSESASTRTISAEGSPSLRHIRTAPQRERFDKHDLRRGFAELKTISHGARATALRHARSPQRVRRAQDKFAWRHSESASTRTISAEGAPCARHTRAAPRPCQQKKHFASQNAHGATTRAHAPAQTQFRARLLHRRQLFTHRASNLSPHLDLHQALTLTARTP